MEILNVHQVTHVKVVPDPWITPMYIAALRIYQRTFGRLPHYGVQIILTETNIPQMIEPKLAWSHCIPIIFYLFQFVLITFSLTSKSINTTDDKHSLVYILQCTMLLFTYIWQIVICNLTRISIFSNGQTFTNYLNYLMSANVQVTKPKYKLSDITGLILVYLNLITVVFGTPLPLVLRYMKVDIWYLLFSDLGFLKAYQTSWWYWILSLLLSSYSYAYGGRDLIIIVTIVFGILISGEGHLSAIIRASKHFCLNQKEYTKLLTIFNGISIAHSSIALYLVMFSLIINCLVLWAAIICFHAGLIAMVATFVSIFIGGMITNIFGINMYTSLYVSSEKLILESRTKERKRKFGWRNTDFQGYLEKMWTAQRCLPMKCGQRFVFSRKAKFCFLDVQFGMLLNVILFCKSVK